MEARNQVSRKKFKKKRGKKRGKNDSKGKKVQGRKGKQLSHTVRRTVYLRAPATPFSLPIPPRPLRYIIPSHPAFGGKARPFVPAIFPVSRQQIV